MTTALLEKQETTISLADMSSDERKGSIYYNMPCKFTFGNGKRKKEIKGLLKGAQEGKIIIDAAKQGRYEMDPSHVFVEPRKTLQKGSIIRALAYTYEHNKHKDGLLVITQTNLPGWKAQTENGEEVEIDPFYFYEPPLAPWQRKELALATQKITIGSKVRRAKGESADEVGEVVEYDNVKGKFRVQWPNRKTLCKPEGLILIDNSGTGGSGGNGISGNGISGNDTDGNGTDGNSNGGSGNVETSDATKTAPKKSNQEPEIGAIVFGEGQNGKGPAKIVNLPREEDGKIKVEWFAGNREWIELESLQLTGDKTFVFLPLTDIKRNGGTQPRATLDSDVIEEYAEHYREGKYEALPPLIVFYDGETYWLADGFHRAAALEKAGFRGAHVDVRQGTRRDAQLYGLGANGGYGLRLSPADKRRAVITMLKDEEWQKWSSRAIAKHCKVGDKLVRKIRKELNPKGESTERIYEKNGKQTTMQTGRIGKSKAEAVERAAPPPSPPSPAAPSEPEPESAVSATSIAPPSPAPAAPSEPEPESAVSATSTTPPSPAPAAPSEPEPTVSATSMTTPSPAPAAPSEPEPEPAVSATSMAPPSPAPAAPSEPEPEPAVSATSMAPPSPAPAAPSEPEPEPIENTNNEALAIRLEAEAFWERISDIREASPAVKNEFRYLLAEKLWE